VLVCRLPLTRLTRVVISSDECVIRLVPTDVDAETGVDGSAIHGQTFQNAPAAMAFAEDERGGPV